MTPTAAAIIAAIMFGLGGALFIWFARKTQRIGKASLTWPMTQGQILKSELKRGSKDRTLTDLSYGYVVAGKNYTGTLASFSGTTNAAEKKRLLEKYPMGSQVPVAYDPANPSFAVLEVGASRTLGMTNFGIVMLVAAAGMVWLAMFQVKN